jgi:RNA polymerase sigma factor (sigma-70 family)
MVNRFFGWQIRHGSFSIDASGDLVGGESFKGAAEFRELLVNEKKDEFIRCLSEKMLTYALGRGLEIADWSNLPDARAISMQVRDILARAIQELPEIYRAVIILRDIEELSTGETAEILEISGDTVKTRLHRARLAVRRSLDKYFREAQALV